MSARTKKSKVRSIRITEELDDLLRQDAKDSGATVNALISSILRKYAEWDRYAERFGYMTISRDAFRALLEAIEDEKLVEIAKDLSPSLAREVALHWFKQVTLNTFLGFLKASSRYTQLGDYQVERSAARDTLAIHHDLGPKWSLLLSRAIARAIESIANISAKLSIEENTFTLSFPPGTLSEDLLA
ncbi:MAG: hypothetical protein V3R48_02220 [Thermoplasmata archaeon]